MNNDSSTSASQSESLNLVDTETLETSEFEYSPDTSSATTPSESIVYSDDMELVDDRTETLSSLTAPDPHEDGESQTLRNRHHHQL